MLARTFFCFADRLHNNYEAVLNLSCDDLG